MVGAIETFNSMVIFHGELLNNQMVIQNCFHVKCEFHFYPCLLCHEHAQAAAATRQLTSAGAGDMAVSKKNIGGSPIAGWFRIENSLKISKKNG